MMPLLLDSAMRPTARLAPVSMSLHRTLKPLSSA